MFHANAAIVSPLQVAADIHALMQHANDNKFSLGEAVEYEMGADRIGPVGVGVARAGPLSGSALGHLSSAPAPLTFFFFFVCVWSAFLPFFPPLPAAAAHGGHGVKTGHTRCSQPAACFPSCRVLLFGGGGGSQSV